MSDHSSQSEPTASHPIRQTCPGCQTEALRELSDFTQVLQATQLVWVEFWCVICKSDIRVFIDAEWENQLVQANLYGPDSLTSRRLISATSGVISWRPQSPGQAELLRYWTLLTTARV